MSEEGEVGAGAGGLDGLSFWNNFPSWDVLFSDNSGGNNTGEMGLTAKKPALPPPPSSSNNPLAEVMGNANQAEAAVEAPSKKRGRGRRRGDGDGKGSGGKVKAGKAGESDHDRMHILTERERRKKMRNMFANLHALIPHLPPKVDKSTIVDEAVNYITALQHTFENLKKQKQERLEGRATVGVGSSSSTAPQKLALNNSREAFLADQGIPDNSSTLEATNVNSSTSVMAPQHPVVFQTWTSANVVLNICGDEAQFSLCSLKKPGLFTVICDVLDKYNIDVVSAHASSDSNRRMLMIQAKVNKAPDHQSTEADIPVEEIYKLAAKELTILLSS